MNTQLQALLAAWRQADTATRSDFAMRTVVECVDAVATVHGIGRPRPARLGTGAVPACPVWEGDQVTLLNRQLAPGDIVELQIEPPRRWIPAWLEGLPADLVGCLVIAGDIVRVPIKPTTLLRYPTRDTTEVRRYLQLFFQMDGIGRLAGHG